jgi:glutathione S-transferase
VLTIWGRLNSHNVKKVAWFADEIGLPYVRHDVGGAFGMDAAYLALNPNALIPTIEDDGVVLWESNAILRYLAARHAPERFWPSDPAIRAQADKWMDWQFDYAVAQGPAFLNLVRYPREKRDEVAVGRSAERAGEMMARVDDDLGRHPWLSGEQFGIGDIPMGVYAHTWFTLAIERPSLKHVAAWYERLKSRPGFAAQVMIPLT